MPASNGMLLTVIRPIFYFRKSTALNIELSYEEEMNDDGLSIFDVERGFLNGKIIERLKDRVTEEWKYLVEGQTIAGDRVVIVTKLSTTGRLIIITVYLVRKQGENQ